MRLGRAGGKATDMLKQHSNSVSEASLASMQRPRQKEGANPVGVSKYRVCFPFAGGLVGGSHISALKLIQSLDRAQFEPIILLHSLDGPLRDFIESAGIPFERAPQCHVWQPGVPTRLREIVQAPRDIWRMRAFLRDRNINIVHTNEGPMHATWALPAKLAGAHHIWHHRGSPDAAGLRLLAPLMARRVLCVSEFAAPRPGFWSASAKASVVYSPFNTSIAEIDRVKSRAALAARLRLDKDILVLAFLGQFADRKRPLVFIEAIAALKRARPHLRLIGLMFGQEFQPGIEARIALRIRELDLADNVRVMGFLLPIEPWLAASDVMIAPAVEEPFGRTLIEAMLVGTPVVAAASGGNIEAIRNGETGLLARVDCPEDLSTLILRLIDQPQLAASIACRAQHEAREKFGVENHVREVTATYREVLAG